MSKKWGSVQFNPMLEVRMGYSWGIRGVFMEYSWDIRMYRVWIGYVSGMFRESVEGDGARGGSYSNFVQEKCQYARINSLINTVYTFAITI